MKLYTLRIKFLSLLAMHLLVVSCMEDEGNYDYSEINEVEIGAIEEDYTVERFKNLVINPEVKFNLDVDGTGDYEYRWVAVEDTGIGIQELTELATTKNLDAPIPLTTGNYFGYYFVKDVKTGIETQYKFNIEVVDSIYEGWLVLSDTNESPRLDMVSLIDGQYEPLYDVLAGSGLELSGEAGFVYTYGYKSNNYGIYVSTSGNGTTRIEQNTFEWFPDFPISNEFLSSQPDDLEIDFMESQSGRTCYTFADGNAYYYNDVSQIAYGSPINNISGVSFNVAPMIGKGGIATYSTLYDVTNRRFLRSLRGNVVTFAPAASTKFDYNDTGMEIVYLTSNDYGGLSGAATFAILKNAETSKYYLAIFNVSNSSQMYFNEIEASNFDQASNIAINPVYGYVFYNVGSKVFRYDWNPEVPELEEVLDAGSDEINMLKFHDFKGNKGNYVEMQNHLIVGRSNGGVGTVEFYDVLSLGPEPLSFVSSYTGFGKVKSISYRQR